MSGFAARIAVVGAGISGLAAAEVLAAAGAQVHVIDMGENPGGRMAVRDLSDGPWSGHVVDIGPAYFTAEDEQFHAQVHLWQERGLVREWFSVATVVDASDRRRAPGPMRYAATAGLRSLPRTMLAELTALPNVTATLRTRVASLAVNDNGLHIDIDDAAPGQAGYSAASASAVAIGGASVDDAVVNGPTPHDADVGSAIVHVAFAGGVTAEVSVICRATAYDAVILACPDPQALRLLQADAFAGVRSHLGNAAWEPAISCTMVLPRVTWPAEDFWFVNDSDVILNIADDGARRGDGTAVLVAHSTPAHARAHLDNPDAAAPAMVAEVARVLGVEIEPLRIISKRWGLARPTAARQGLYAWDGQTRIAVCGDGWAGKPRIEGAWLSGRAAARQVLAAVGL